MCRMFQDQNCVAKFHRITQLNLRKGMQGILTETANGLVTVAILSVIFFTGRDGGNCADTKQLSVDGTTLA